MNIDAANTRVIDSFQQADSCMLDIQPAKDVIPGMTEAIILHAGAPIAPQRMCKSMRWAYPALWGEWPGSDRPTALDPGHTRAAPDGLSNRGRSAGNG